MTRMEGNRQRHTLATQYGQDFEARSSAAVRLQKDVWDAVEAVASALSESEEIRAIGLSSVGLEFHSYSGASFITPAGDTRAAPKNSLNFGRHDNEIMFTRKLVSELGISRLVDVGANIGWYSVNLAQEFHDIYILAIEPIRHVGLLLQSNIRRNSLTRVKHIPVGLSASPGHALMYWSDDWTGRSTLENRIARPGDTTVEVELKTLDQLVLEENFAPVEYLKIDVEGHEHSVLSGAVRTISEYRPIIQIEMLDKFFATGPAGVDETRKSLRAAGYREFRANHQRHELSPVSLSDRPGNTFFIPEHMLTQLSLAKG